MRTLTTHLPTYIRLTTHPPPSFARDYNMSYTPASIIPDPRNRLLARSEGKKEVRMLGRRKKKRKIDSYRRVGRNKDSVFIK